MQTSLGHLWITQSLMFTRQMLLKPKKGTMLRILFSLVCVKCIFLWFCWSVRLEGINKHAKKGITSAMECFDLATFTFATWQIRSCLLCEFISLGARLFSFPSIFHIFSQKKWIVELFYWSEFRDRKENETFAGQAKNTSKHARITSLVGK